MNKPLVSVIMPAYKAENIILEALMSVKGQTYTAWEIIVVEDASKDRTEEIVREFAKDVGEHKVKYIRHQSNQGVSATRNTAIKSASGDYLAFLDYDDLWKENHLYTAVNHLEKSGADLAYSSVEMFKDGTNKIIGSWGPVQQDLAEFPASLLSRNYIPSNVVVMKSSICKKVGYFDSTLKAAEDLDYWLRVAEVGFKFVYIPGVYGSYRKKQSSSLTANEKLVNEEHARVLRKYSNLSIVPAKVRQEAILQYHLKAIKFNLTTNPLKALELLLWILRLSPQPFLLTLINRLVVQLRLKHNL